MNPLPVYDFACRACKKVFEERVPAGVRISTCVCGEIADRRFSPRAQIKIPEGFREITRSDVVAEKKTRLYPVPELKK